MKSETTIQDVTQTGLIVKIVQGPSIMICLMTPPEVLQAIRTLKDGLFEWSKLTGKSIDEGNPS